jgi:hypothetical protein
MEALINFFIGGAAGDAQNPTVWTDKLRITDPKRQGKNLRGLILSRWGGMGTHRYQVSVARVFDGLENQSNAPTRSASAATSSR